MLSLFFPSGGLSQQTHSFFPRTTKNMKGKNVSREKRVVVHLRDFLEDNLKKLHLKPRSCQTFLLIKTCRSDQMASFMGVELKKTNSLNVSSAHTHPSHPRSFLAAEICWFGWTSRGSSPNSPTAGERSPWRPAFLHMRVMREDGGREFPAPPLLLSPLILLFSFFFTCWIFCTETLGISVSKLNWTAPWVYMLKQNY